MKLIVLLVLLFVGCYSQESKGSVKEIVARTLLKRLLDYAAPPDHQDREAKICCNAVMSAARKGDWLTGEKKCMPIAYAYDIVHKKMDPCSTHVQLRMFDSKLKTCIREVMSIYEECSGNHVKAKANENLDHLVLHAIQKIASNCYSYYNP